MIGHKVKFLASFYGFGNNKFTVEARGIVIDKYSKSEIKEIPINSLEAIKRYDAKTKRISVIDDYYIVDAEVYDKKSELWIPRTLHVKCSDVTLDKD